MRLHKARVNVFKLIRERPKNVFGKWKEIVKFVGEIDSDGVPSKRLFTTNPDDMGKVLALNVRKMEIDSAELASDIPRTQQDRVDGKPSTLEKTEIEPIFNALVGELGVGNVENKASR